MASCASLIKSDFNMVVDKNVSAEKSAVVTFFNDEDGHFIIKKWNNIDVKDELYGDKNIWSKGKTVLTVPAGDNSFTFDVAFTLYFSTGLYSQNKSHIANNIVLNYNLQAGKKYQIEAVNKLITIYDITDKKTQLKEWDLG
jgi:hypothetical protein